MPKVSLTASLRREYETLFDECAIRPERAAGIQTIATKLVANKKRYEDVTDATGVPWFFVAVVHNMEASGKFTCHLHNGDPLTARTVQVPQGRPKTGTPPFTWEQSACDALGLKALNAQTDWSLAGTLYQLESYNGWGYRLYHPYVLSPYLWAGSTHYTSGKYVADGTWSDLEVSKQNGAAVLLRRLAELEHVAFADQPPPAPDDPPLVVEYAKKRSTDPAVVQRAKDLQRWLNTFPGIFVRMDGVPGDRTSEAYRKVTGSYLAGDPRA
jgi:lysozyme family protein